MRCADICTRIFLVIALAGFAGCSRRPATAEAPAKPSATVVAAKPLPALDVCALLTAQEIKNITGETPTATTPGHSEDAGFEVSQCFFNLPTYSNSIVVSVTRRGTGSDGRDPKEFWEKKIEHPEEGEREEEEKHREPDRVEGLGDSAVWSGTAVGGALYVLKGNAFIRIGVGTFVGGDKRKEKVIELARLVLGRL